MKGIQHKTTPLHFPLLDNLTMSTPEQITFERNGPVGQLKLNRSEKRNAQTLQMWRELAELGQQLTASPGDLKVVVVSGAGGCFSSGVDTSIFTTGELLTGNIDGREIQAAFSWLRSDRFITIAAIEKFAIGAGLEIALWCDMRLATEGSVFALPEVEFGIIPDLGGCSLLPEIVGYGRAMDLITTARKIDAQEAHRWGLLNDVVPAAELQQRVDALVSVLLKRSPTVLRGAKRATLAALQDTSKSLGVSLEAIRDCLTEIAGRMKR